MVQEESMQPCDQDMQVDKELQEAADGSLVLTQTHLDAMREPVNQLAAAGKETS
jgi:hypothetical protein